jgi:hypothetical protein
MVPRLSGQPTVSRPPFPTLMRAYWHLGAVGLIGGVISMALWFPEGTSIRVAAFAFGLVLLGPSSVLGLYLGEITRRRLGTGPFQTVVIWLLLGLVVWAAWRFAN